MARIIFEDRDTLVRYQKTVSSMNDIMRVSRELVKMAGEKANKEIEFLLRGRDADTVIDLLIDALQRLGAEVKIVSSTVWHSGERDYKIRVKIIP